MSLFKSLYDSLLSQFDSYQRNFSTSPEECFCCGEVNGSQSGGLQEKLVLIVSQKEVFFSGQWESENAAAGFW